VNAALCYTIKAGLKSSVGIMGCHDTRGIRVTIADGILDTSESKTASFMVDKSRVDARM
jgi:hypothetical protein